MFLAMTVLPFLIVFVVMILHCFVVYTKILEKSDAEKKEEEEKKELSTAEEEKNLLKSCSFRYARRVLLNFCLRAVHTRAGSIDC